MIRDPLVDRSPRELKVEVPVLLHLKLHVLKVREGRRISDVVAEALREHFDRKR